MSVLDFPRIHFKGVARVNVPTGNRNVENTLDIATNTVFKEGSPFDLSQHPSEYHHYLKSLGQRYDQNGQPDDKGIFNDAAGYNMMGNNHFSWENTCITAVQTKAGELQENDALVGCKLSLWGHYNEYLRTTFNRARWVDNDPTRRDSALIYAGQLTLTHANGNASDAHILSADIDCTHGVRWLNPGYITERPAHFMQAEMAEARLFQFAVKKDSKDFLFNQLGFDSPFLNTLERALAEPDVEGLLVQYCVSNLSPPSQPDVPVFCDLHGTIGLWRKQDMMTCPTGRMLFPKKSQQFAPIAVTRHGDWISLNMAISLPHSRYMDALPVQGGMPPKLDKKAALGELRLFTSTGVLVAIIPEALYQQCTHGVIDVPCLLKDANLNLADVSLCLSCTEHTWYEDDWYVQAEQHICAVESSRKGDCAQTSASPAKTMAIRSYFRGQPSAVSHLATHVGTPTILRCDSHIQTNDDGKGTLNIYSLGAGSGDVFLGEHRSPVQVRVLSDDWDLLNVPDEAITYEFLYTHVMGYYELIYPFMADKVFSMADKCKCETYARLMWQMCDPSNRDKSYYMPSTREMSAAKSQLFLKYLSNVEKSAVVPDAHAHAVSLNPAPKPDETPSPKIRNKHELIQALKDAIDLELSIMLQYLYSAYSLPNYAAGEQQVALGHWQQAQLELVNGGADRRRNSGWRGALLEIAHEEMIHYLIINNILMSLGEPFYSGRAVLGDEASQRFGLDTEFALEPFSEHGMAKFVRFEWPQFMPTVGRSIADFYSDIRLAITDLPDLYSDTPVRAGGEHHLFLNELMNKSHPAYQFEVFDRNTALFAIDFVTEQGEGAPKDAARSELSHFHRLRTIAKSLSASDLPFEPAYPVLKNPVLSPRTGGNTVIHPGARQLMAFYLSSYELMNQMMMHHFAQVPCGSLRRSRLMNAAIDLMTGILRPLSVQLMTMPSGLDGRNAGPPAPEKASSPVATEYSEGCLALSQRCDALIGMARAMTDAKVPLTYVELLQFYQNQMQQLASGVLSREG